MKSALERVEAILQGSDTGLTIQKIMINADVTEIDAKASVRTLSSMGQIEVIPTQGRWGNRYAWLGPISKPEPEPSPASEIEYDMLEVLDEIEQETEKILQSRADAEEPPRRYLLTVPKRKPRIMTCAAKAQEAAQAAVRNGSNRAEVYVLTHIGTATRGVFWDSMDGNDNGIS